MARAEGIVMNITGWIYRKLFLDNQLDKIRREQRILKAQFDHLTSFSNKAVRRKWKRMLTNKNSPFYLFK